MGLSATQLAELRQDLEALVPLIEAALAGSAEAARPVKLDPSAIGRVSRIDAIQQQQMIEANREAQRARLQRVRSALRRFDADTYADCLECGESVGYERLKARPETLFCIRCQNARERS